MLRWAEHEKKFYNLGSWFDNENKNGDRHNEVQSTLVISNSKGLSETLRDILTSRYQSCGGEENSKSNNHI